MKRLRQHRHRRLFAAMRWLNAGFLILAACRALVPGLCATQLASKDAQQRRAGERTCCTACCEVPAEGHAGVHAPLPDRPSCAFCLLIQGMLDPLVPCHFSAPKPGQLRAQQGPLLWLRSELTLTRLGRAPPPFFVS